MRSWLYLHPTWAWLISLVGFLVCAYFTVDVALNTDGWWRLLALGWASLTWRCMDAVERFWRLS